MSFDRGNCWGVVIPAIIFAVIAIIAVWMTCIAVVPAGTVGIKNTFGVVEDTTFQPGLHIKSPFTDVISMSTRTQKYMDYGNSDTATITALSNDGLSTSMGIAINYHINPDKATEVYKIVGEDYQSVIMVNPIHSVPRDMISKYDTKTLYSASQTGASDRAKLENELYLGISERINEMGVRDSIVIEQVSIRNIDFPDVYKNAIVNKMKMDTEIAEKELEVRKQEMEAKRVIVQAEGTAKANDIIKQSLTPEYLQWYWIETMKSNPKTIYVPIGETGSPIVLTKQIEE